MIDIYQKTFVQMDTNSSENAFYKMVMSQGQKYAKFA